MKYVILTLVFFINSYAEAEVKECNIILANKGRVIFTQHESTNLAGLPVPALKNIFESLKGKWIQVNAREVIPIDGRPKDQTVLMRVLGVQERHGRDEAVGHSSSSQKVDNVVPDVAHFFNAEQVSGAEENRGEENLLLVGTVAGFYSVGSSDKEIDEDLLHKYLLVKNIVSVRLIDGPEIAYNLINLYKPNGRPRLVFNSNIEQTITTMAEGDLEAIEVLGILMGSPLEFDGKDISFEALLKTMARQNIRGAQIVAVYREYAKGSLNSNTRTDKAANRFVYGIFGNPDKVADVVNRSLAAAEINYKHLAVNPSFLMK